MAHKADLVSSTFERWRYSDRPAAGVSSVIVRDQGDVLTATTDYDHEDNSVIALVSEAGEPVTVETVSQQEYLLRDMLAEILIERSSLDAADVDVRRLGSIYANAASLVTRRAPVHQVLGKILAGVGGHATLRRAGTLALDALLPPTSPGPRGGPCVEIASAGVSGDGSIVWETGADLLTQRDFTLGAWVKTHRFGPTDNTQFGDLLVLRVAGTNDELRLSIDLDEGAPLIELEWYRLGVLTTQRRVPAGNFFGDAMGAWYFVGAVNDEAAGTLSFYGAHEGDSTLAFLGSTEDIPWANAFPIADGVASLTDVNVGHDEGLVYEMFRGGIAEPQVWDTALSFTAVENAFKDTLPNTTGRVFFAALNGLSASALVDVHSSTAPTVTGDVSERPNLVVDLTRNPMPMRRRNLTPAERIEVRYAANDALTPEQIAPAVSRSERLALQQAFQVAPYNDPGAGDDYLDAREIVVDSPWKTKAGAEATLRLLRWRYAPGREYALLGPGGDAPHRHALLIETGDEVQVIGYQDLADPGQHYRVVENRRAVGTLDAQLALWR